MSVELEESPEYSASSYTMEVCIGADQKEVVTFPVTLTEVGKVNLTFSTSIDTSKEDCGGSISTEKR